MAVRPPDLVYAVDERPPWPHLLALGLQYAILVVVYLVLIGLVARAAGASPAVSQSLVSLGLVAAAAGTALQAWPGRFFGSGFLAPPVFSAIYLAPCLIAAERGGLPAVAGMTIFAGLVEIVLSRFVTRLRIVFQPLVTGFTILVVGIQFGLVAVSHALDISDPADPEAGLLVLSGLLTFAICVSLSIWGRGVLRLMAVLIGLATGTILSGLLVGAPEVAAMAAAPWLALPDPSFLSWSIDPSLLPVFFAAGLAATIRTVGVITTCQSANDAAWKRPDAGNLARGVTADGLGTTIAGLVGVLGMCVAPSMVGVSRATGATSRYIAFAAAGFLLAFAFVPKVAAAILSLPLEVIGGILLFTSSFIIASGIQIMAARGLDPRASFAVSVALLLGLSSQLYPGYYAHLPDGLRTITGDMLTLSLFTVTVLILVFRIGIRRNDRIAWSDSDAAVADFARALDTDSKSWKLDDDTVSRAKDSVASVIGHLKDGRYLEEPASITASFDQLELCVELAYRGRPMHLVPHGGSAGDLTEESAATGGLSVFALGINADRSAVATKDDRVTIRLWFAV